MRFLLGSLLSINHYLMCKYCFIALLIMGVTNGKGCDFMTANLLLCRWASDLLASTITRVQVTGGEEERNKSRSQTCFLKHFTVYIFPAKAEGNTLISDSESWVKGTAETWSVHLRGRVFLWCHHLLSSSRRPPHLYPQKIAIRRGFRGEGRVGKGWTTGSRLHPGLEPQKEWYDRKWCCLSEDGTDVVVLLLLVQFLLRWSLPSWREICLRHGCKWKVEQEYLAQSVCKEVKRQNVCFRAVALNLLMLWP